jgi:FkbM family methyltransferase
MAALIHAYRSIVPGPVRDLVWHLRAMAVARDLERFRVHLANVRPALRIALGRPFAHVAVSGLRLRVDCRDLGVGRPLYLRGAYEPDETALLLRILKPGMVFFDVGANIGYFTTLAARLVGENGRVLAAEPDPENFALLKQNVSENGLCNVVLFNCALGAQAGDAQLFRAASNKGDHRLYADGDRQRDSVSVKVDTFDNLVRMANVCRVDAVKMDVQGYEGHVVAGMEGTLSCGNDMTILTEFWPEGLECAGSTGSELWDTLARFGFEASFVGGNAGLNSIRYTDVADYLSRIVVHEGSLDASGRCVNLLLHRGRF